MMGTPDSDGEAPMPAALANYRKARAVEMALAGCSYDDIASDLRDANRGTAWRTVLKALKARA